MARSFTLAQLRAAVQRRGSYENSADITPTLLNDFINEAVAECYDLLVEKWADYYTVSTTLATVIGVEAISLPADFYKLRKLEVLYNAASSPQQWCRLWPHELEVSHEYLTLYGKAYRYRLQAGNIILVPLPVAVESLRMYYIPAVALLAADGDTFDGINGYEELVVQLALLRCKRREELPTDDIEREVARLGQRVRSAADGRDATEAFSLDEYHHAGSDGRGMRQWWGF